MSSEDYLKDISEIKSLMNKSSRFISLSGLSGIFAGIYALVGAGYFFITSENLILSNFSNSEVEKGALVLIMVAIFSTFTTVVFTSKRAKSLNEKSWDNKTKNLLESFLNPIIVGLLFAIILFFRQEYTYLLPLLLIFYGLGLVNSANKTSNIVKPLGYIQIITGLICTIFFNYTFWFFTIGFGLVHLIYGSIIYLKFDK